jgi:hypothetical protein
LEWAFMGFVGVFLSVGLVSRHGDSRSVVWLVW